MYRYMQRCIADQIHNDVTSDQVLLTGMYTPCATMGHCSLLVAAELPLYRWYHRLVSINSRQDLLHSKDQLKHATCETVATAQARAQSVLDVILIICRAYSVRRSHTP